ncbi:MAG: 4-oxalocrotonate decarboxylase [Glaciimonas sp.]|nr:4-oxalocrotonate decarboxylase [Glaciimonas sp.]
MSSLSNRYAHQLLDARAMSRLVVPLSSDACLSLEDAYDIAHSISSARIAQGETIIGRRIGFIDCKLDSEHDMGVTSSTLIWAPLFDATVRTVDRSHCIQSLTGAVQPRLEASVVFRLGRTPAPDAGLDALADCIEWMASGLEIVICPYPDWKFTAVDAIAAFGLHGALLIGEPRPLPLASRRNLALMLSHASVSLSCGGWLRAAGYGSDVMGSPVHALLHLHQQLQAQPRSAPLLAGEIIATGAWAAAIPIEAGQTWSTAFSAVNLAGMSITLV